MPEPDPSVVFLHLAIGDYRNDFLLRIAAALPRLQVITGDVHQETSFTASRRLTIPVTRVTNRYLLDRRLVWQRSATLACIRSDECVVEHNPRNLNNWIVPAARRLRGRKTVMWGHVESRTGRKPVIGRLRHLQRRLGGVALYYTEEERRLAEATYGAAGIDAYVAPNALYAAADWSEPPTDPPTDVIVIGRLAPDKKPEVAVRAFAEARLPSGTVLHVVGDGPQRPLLENLARTLPLDGKVIQFHGHVGDRERLRDLFQRSIAAISPGYIGLSITQATYFGCPMIFSRPEPHAPEHSLAREGFNCIAVEQTEPALFARALETAAERFADPERRREIALDSVKSYSTELMADGFVAAVRHRHGRR